MKICWGRGGVYDIVKKEKKIVLGGGGGVGVGFLLNVT
jgi:hypothetical protein